MAKPCKCNKQTWRTSLTSELASSFEPEFIEIWEKVKPFTMTSVERAYALWSAVNLVVDSNIIGSFVECGVWRGGSSMLIALTLLARQAGHYEIFMFDTFEGMSEPGPYDKDLHGSHATALMEGEKGSEIAELVKAAASYDDVRKSMESTGYDMRLVRMIKGDVKQTLPQTQTLRIALLRLDTDFYDSTLSELQNLYPRLAKGGILIIDDYGHWQGAKRAVDEYFADPSTAYKKPMLWCIDYTGRGAVKLEDTENLEIERYDYTPPGVTSPRLLELFPEATPQNPWSVSWPYLRPHVPHLWRSDQRNDTPYTTGNASVEEAACLYELARQFSGKRGIEIGTHYGWTAAHLLAAGLRLDCVDPELSREVRVNQVSEALDQVETTGSYRLWGGFSPAILEEVRNSQPDPWSFAFIDGSHDGTAPADDARGVLPFLANDAVVVFHDLTSPHVAAGLSVFKKAGFSTRLLNTMQILGVAWRGNVTIFDHVADENIFPIFIPHLQEFMTR
jgi:predicted O-methyltransferase YrrM